MRLAIIIAVGIGLVATPGVSLAGDMPEGPTGKADFELITGAITPPDPTADAGQYCVNVANQAADARFAWQAKTIEELEKEIDKRIAELETKRAEYQEWMKRREAIIAETQDHVVSIYAKMNAEAAAKQLATLDSDIAVALLNKLNARIASGILSQMEPAVAAKLTKAMVDAVKKPAEAPKS